MRTFFDLPNTNSVCLFCLKNDVFTKKTSLLHKHPKKHSFSGLFFLQHKKDKNKKCTIFFRIPFFWHPDKLPKNFFAPLHTICVFSDAQKHYKTGGGGKQANKTLGPSFDATLDQVLTQKTQILDQVLGVVGPKSPNDSSKGLPRFPTLALHDRHYFRPTFQRIMTQLMDQWCWTFVSQVPLRLVLVHHKTVLGPASP